MSKIRLGIIWVLVVIMLAGWDIGDLDKYKEKEEYDFEELDKYKEKEEYDFEDLDKLEDVQEYLEAEVKDTEDIIGEYIVEIEKLEDEIESINEVIELNKKEIEKVEERIREVEEEIEELEVQISKRKDILKVRLQSIQEVGEVSYISVILGSENFMDFISRVTKVTTIMGADQDIVNKIEEDVAEVEKKLKEEEKLRADLQDIEDINKKYKKELKRKINDIEDKKEDLEERIQEIGLGQEELDKLFGEVREQLGMKVGLGEGDLEWPTEGGYVSSVQGIRKHPIYDIERYHKGIDIARTDRGVVPPIYAAEDGEVTLVRHSNAGYGNRIDIKHADGIETLYAHLSEIDVEEGQKVRRGQRIGLMGTTGQSTGIHLHFEVYEDGELQNPLNYFEEKEEGT